MDRIPEDQIAVVVQGPVLGRPEDPPGNRITQQGLSSVRRNLAGAEVILSTWEGSNTSGLDYDRLILSQDPGPEMYQLTEQEGPRPTNVNRMIVSTLAGLQATTKPYVLKARSDLRLRSTRFLDYFGQYPARGAIGRVFAQRVLTYDRYTRHPDRSGPSRFLFHPSDCFQFGLGRDLSTLWEAPLVRTSHGADLVPLELLNEQYIWVNCLRKHLGLDFTGWSQSSWALHELAEHVLANNFIVLGSREFGIESRQFSFDLWQWMTTYSHGDWRQLYAKCSGIEPIDASPVVSLKRATFALHQWPRVFNTLRPLVNQIARLLGD
jgi:hypothetical protein